MDRYRVLHLSPNGDMPDPLAQEQSFSLANIVPQVHENNAGVWASIESAVRQLALDEGELYVISGPAFIGSDIKQIGGRVLVPTHLWKVVYSPTRKQAAAYLITNDATKDYSVLSVAELARFAGIDPLPALPQKAKDTAMKLPKPVGRGGASARGRPGRAAEEEFSLRDFVRDALERFGAGGRAK